MILCTFEDGTTELRPANSYAHWADADRLRRYKKIGKNEIGEIERGSFFTIAEKRGMPSYCFAVWRITGQDPVTKALTGEWQACRVETSDEQIERLPRDFAERTAQWERRGEHLNRLAMAHAAILGALHGEDTTADAERAEADLAAHDDGSLPIAEIVRRLLAAKEG